MQRARFAPCIKVSFQRYCFQPMKTITFEQARSEFETIFRLAAGGETIVVEKDEQRIALRRFVVGADPEFAPPGYFANDYSPEDVAELNSLASQAPQFPLP